MLKLKPINKAIIMILICLYPYFCMGQTKDSLSFNVTTIENGYLSKIEIWSPYKLYYFYVYSQKKKDRVRFDITTCKNFLLLDTSLDYMYINDLYPNEITNIQKIELNTWRKKMDVFKKFKKRKHINDELNYYISSVKCNLKVIKYSPLQNAMFEHYWGSSLLPNDLDSENKRYIVIDIYK